MNSRCDLLPALFCRDEDENIWKRLSDLKEGGKEGENA